MITSEQPIRIVANADRKTRQEMIDGLTKVLLENNHVPQHTIEKLRKRMQETNDRRNS